MKTRDGRSSGVIFGFLNGLKYVVKDLDLDLDDIVVCWDNGRSKKRLELYPQYKANRTKEVYTPEEETDYRDYCMQLDELGAAMTCLGVKQVRVRGVEGDDVIAVLSSYYSELEDVIIYSGDRDLHQLVSDRVCIYTPDKVVKRKKDILQEWDVTDISYIPYIKALVGDPGDNIKGLEGVGPIRAKRLLYSYFDVLGRALKEGKENVDSSVIEKKDEKYFTAALDNLNIVKRNLLIVTLYSEDIIDIVGRK